VSIVIRINPAAMLPEKQTQRHESKPPFEEMRGQSPHLNNEGTVPSFLRAFRYHDRCMVGDKILDTQEVGRLNPGLQVDWRQHRIKLAR